ncbi:MAG: hypothetical protein ABUR63_01995, partial [Verrucomicrobiota bacterium]
MIDGADQPGDLLSRALDILSREATRILPGGWSPPKQVGDTTPGREGLQRQIEALVDSVFGASTKRAAPGPVGEMVPVLSALAPVRAGESAEISATVTNEDASERTLTLFGTNLTSESGHEIPSLRLSVVPRQATLAPSASASFTVRVAVPHQSAPGHYAGLL